jgi:imidazole glycerol-phosphate synthase subunit HisH
MIDVVIIDYGVGNILSVKQAFESFHVKVEVSSDPKKILEASHTVLPGVGAFGNAMNALKECGLVDTVIEIGKKGKPLLGICLGMQLLLDESKEFGNTMGLGLISGKVIPIPEKSKLGHPLKSTNIGWGKLKPKVTTSDWIGTALEDINESDYLYFVHSFMAQPKNVKNVIAETCVGGNNIPSVISNGNIIACQFHPEKSGPTGLKILRRFCEY